MKRIDNDTFYDYIKQYDTDSEYHLVGEVDYHLLSDDKPYVEWNLTGKHCVWSLNGW